MIGRLTPSLGGQIASLSSGLETVTARLSQSLILLDSINASAMGLGSPLDPDVMRRCLSPDNPFFESATEVIITRLIYSSADAAPVRLWIGSDSNWHFYAQVGVPVVVIQDVTSAVRVAPGLRITVTNEARTSLPTTFRVVMWYQNAYRYGRAA